MVRLPRVEGAADRAPAQDARDRRVDVLEEQHLAVRVDGQDASRDARDRLHQSVPTSMAALSRASSLVSPSYAGFDGDPLGATGRQGAEQVAVLDQHLALVERLGGVQLQLGAGVGDVEVAHRQLPDPVGRPERRGLHTFHRQLVGVVGERRAVGAQDGVVLAAPQPERHLAGDQRGDPALHRLAQHQGLRVEPAALVEQPAEPAALVVIAGEGVLVVDRVEQPLVDDPEQGHAGRLVDAPRLGLDDPVLDLVGHAEAVPTADRR